MKWIKWKFRELKQWFICFVIYRSYWKKLFNSESRNANWEIWHDSNKKTVMLHYVPKDDYSDKDVKIEIPYDQFEDLVKFLIRIA